MRGPEALLRAPQAAAQPRVRRADPAAGLQVRPATTEPRGQSAVSAGVEVVSQAHRAVLQVRQRELVAREVCLGAFRARAPVALARPDKQALKCAAMTVHTDLAYASPATAERGSSSSLLDFAAELSARGRASRPTHGNQHLAPTPSPSKPTVTTPRTTPTIRVWSSTMARTTTRPTRRIFSTTSIPRERGQASSMCSVAPPPEECCATLS
jgi:hypothetical protein